VTPKQRKAMLKRSEEKQKKFEELRRQYQPSPLKEPKGEPAKRP
jgi:hypothetical protein